MYEDGKRKKLQEEVEYIKDRVLTKFPLLGVTMSHLKIVATGNFRTADKLMGTTTTDGETIYYHSEYFEPLLDDEKIFILAHEVMHVAFNHILRSEGKDQKLWGLATDSVINQILKSEGLPLVKGSVDNEDAIDHSAEEMYEKLLTEREQKQEKGDICCDDPANEQIGYDSHEIWKEVVKQVEEKKTAGAEKQKNPQDEKEQQENDGSFGEGDENGEADFGSDEVKQKGQEEKQQNSDDEREQIGGESNGIYQNEQQDDEVSSQRHSDFERNFSNENRKEREMRADEFENVLNKQKNTIMAEMAQESGISFGNLGKSEAALDWKKTLKKSLEDEEYRWSYRRSNADNDYMARIEEREDEELAETEVMLDVSGSVDVELLKEFLRQLKPILQTSRLKVGCFDEYFYGLKEIKTSRDIDNFKIISKSKWTENWNLAVKSFSKRKDVNKIVFTDGYPAPGTMPDESTRNINVIWIVYGNKSFNPICGKVLQVDLAPPARPNYPGK
jgi:predicted metal-dependent peptidase